MKPIFENVMQKFNQEQVGDLLVAFKTAWKNSIEDYKCRKINSEHTLQAVLYFHLRRQLAENLSIYTEAVIRLPERVAHEMGRRKFVVDLLICDESNKKSPEIVLAIEIKYVPRGEPSPHGLRKDIVSLSNITNRRSRDDRVTVEMPRFRKSDSETIFFNISVHRKLILAAYCCGNEKSVLSKEKFWKFSGVRPEAGYWSDFTNAPKNLGVALAITDVDGGAAPRYFGGPFDEQCGACSEGDA